MERTLLDHMSEVDTGKIEAVLNPLLAARVEATCATINQRTGGTEAGHAAARKAHADYAERYRRSVEEIVGLLADVRSKNNARAEIIHDLRNEVGGLRLCIDGALAELATLGDDPSPEAMAAVLGRIDDLLCASRP